MTIKKKSGFTVIELIFVVSVLGFASILFFSQKNNLNIVNLDNQRKISINAMYYSLEEVFYETNEYYPREISSENLKSVDPELFNDPNGIAINELGSDYTYSSFDCVDNNCKSYELKAILAKEDDYIKTNRN